MAEDIETYMSSYPVSRSVKDIDVFKSSGEKGHPPARKHHTEEQTFSRNALYKRRIAFKSTTIRNRRNLIENGLQEETTSFYQYPLGKPYPIASQGVLKAL